MTLRKVLAGEQFVAPAATWNAFIDAAQDFKDRTADIGRQPVAGFRSSGIITVKNESGGARRQFDVLGLGEPMFPLAGNVGKTSFDSLVAFRGVMPTKDMYTGRFAILMEPLAAGAIGRAVAAGVCPVRLTVDDDKAVLCDVKNNDATSLTTNPTGSATILWRESGSSGTVWAIVRIGTPAAEAAVTIFGRITSNSSDGSNRWSYRFIEVEKTQPGYGGWTDVDGGITGTVRNVIEDQNTSSGTLGNGVSVDNLTSATARFLLQPIPTGTRVMITPVTLTNGVVEYWTQYANGVDGGCI